MPTMRLLLTVAILSGVLASSVSAAQWHTNGIRPFASTNAGAMRTLIHPDPGGLTPVILQCPTSSASFTLNGPTAASLPWISAATNVVLTFGVGNCTVNGVPGYTVLCSSASFRAESYVGGNTLATGGGGVTRGAITGIDCRLSLGATQCSTITGTVPTDYVNPNPINTGSGRFTLTNAAQLLGVAKIGSGCAAVPDGTGTLGSVSGAGIGDLTYTVHGPNAAYIIRSL